MSDKNTDNFFEKYTTVHNAIQKPVSLLEQVSLLNEIGSSLSSEQDTKKLMEKILVSAKKITNADGGTFYHRKGNSLQFTILINDSLNIHQDGSSKKVSNLPEIELCDKNKTPNYHNVASYAALNKETVNIADAYENKDFDFSGTRKFDEAMHYTSTSFLTVPIIDHKDNVIAVIQLINAKNYTTGETDVFSIEHQKLVESLASQAAVSLSNKKLIEDQRILFEAFIELIAGAIDDKSPHTGDHCRRVPELTLLLAQAVIDTNKGPLASFNMSEDEFYALKIAGWLHDCGKIITPDHVMEKSTKLETIHDRIHEVKARFEILKRDAKINYLEAFSTADNKVKLLNDHETEVQQLNDDQQFICMANIGSEFITDDHKDRINQIACYTWVDADGNKQPLLSHEEIYNLHISRGTLTAEEREIINGHMTATIKMLDALPYPEHLTNVPEYAGGHHEKMDGTGYPKGLTREQMSVPARIMGVADIFEAITAKDRPYRDGTTLTDALNILGSLKLKNHIDPDVFDVFDVFIEKKIYLTYAKMFMSPEQIDKVDHSKIKGYEHKS